MTYEVLVLKRAEQELHAAAGSLEKTTKKEAAAMAAERFAPVLVKVLGLYCAVQTFIGVVMVVSGLILMLTGAMLESDAVPWSRSLEFTSTLVGLMRPAAYFCAAYVLIRKTDWCLASIGLGQTQDAVSG